MWWVVVAHSNREVIRIASNLAVTWNRLGAFLEPLKPRRLALIACTGGRSNAG